MPDGEDYRIDSTTVSVAAEEMSKSFTVNIIDDDITECDETFKLRLGVPSSICGAVNGKTDSTEVTIKDEGSRSFGNHVMLFIHSCTNQQE